MALEIKVVTSPQKSAAVLKLVTDHPGVAEVELFPGASVVPAGDVIIIQALRDVTDELLAQLHELHIAVGGSVTVSSPELIISQRLDKVDEELGADGDEAIIWDEVTQKTSEDSKLTWSFLAFMIIAVGLASIGIVTNSLITIVGAMVVGPDFGPLAALALGLADRKWTLARKSTIALLVAFPAAIGVTAVATLISVQTHLFDSNVLNGSSNATDFIYHPGPYSFIVALLAGTAGMLSLIGRKSAVLVGVFISVTTVPAAGYIAVALVLGAPDRAGGSALQLLFNMAGIVAAGAAVLLIYRLFRRRRPLPSLYSGANAVAKAHSIAPRNPFRG